MVGLVFIDTLNLTLLQSFAIMVNMLLCFAAYRGTFEPWKVGICSVSFLLYAFWGAHVSRDSFLLFNSCQYLSQFTWSEYLSAFAHQNYVRYQPPFVSFLISKLPSYHVHQIATATISVSFFMSLPTLYGKNAFLFLSTPLAAIMMVQPSTDMWLFVAMIFVVQCVQQKKTTLAGILYGVAFLVKPLAVILLPFVVVRVRWKIVLSLAIVAIYTTSVYHTYFGYGQTRFFLKQIMVVSSIYKKGRGQKNIPRGNEKGQKNVTLQESSKKQKNVPRDDDKTHKDIIPRDDGKTHKDIIPRESGKGATGTPRSLQGVPKIAPLLTMRWGRVWSFLRARWDKLGKQALVAAPFYLFPVYIVGGVWTWFFCLAVIVGYGNIKYLFFLVFTFRILGLRPDK